MASQNKVSNYSLPDEDELEDAYEALWATLKNKFGTKIDDDEELKQKYKQLINQGPKIKYTLKDIMADE